MITFLSKGGGPNDGGEHCIGQEWLAIGKRGGV